MEMKNMKMWRVMMMLIVGYVVGSTTTSSTSTTGHSGTRPPAPSNKYPIIHVNWIQQKGINYLFRGGTPNPDHVFEYKTLTETMSAAAQREAHVTIPSNLYVVDICLLNANNSWEIPDILAERSYFTANPDKGTFVPYPINGENLDPSTVSAANLPNLARTFDVWSRDKLPDFIESIGKRLSNTNSRLPSALYIHCMCGCDRTGEVSGSYYLRYMNMTLKQAHEIDVRIAEREIFQISRNALAWYCLFLKYAKGYDLTCQY